MVVEFECRTQLPVRIDVAFDQSRSIDAHTASMAASRERAVDGVTSGLIGLGEEVTWSARHFGVRLRMTSRITGMQRPEYFVDEQLRGPFSWFRHEHRFESNGDGTLMTDRVKFAAPFGPLGRLAELVVGPYLRRLIEHRGAFLASSTHE